MMLSKTLVLFYLLLASLTLGFGPTCQMVCLEGFGCGIVDRGDWIP